ncbi:protein neuralized isoform X5 [Nilaparvata lugens]|uniref:protein neuralized isoform X4 n=1 Tax=Nilaparvata lugens TaxID=108931 RepID=UPI00193D0058|nr:protein neuralized isoform X4 [Nilaparvata lugens]XP_039282487.1 protein neuralized isoform X5 [Nilaparvata lugens]
MKMGQTGSNVCQTPRSNNGGGGTNNLPPLLFHQVHGDNIRIIRDGFVARRAESFCKGVTFTNRPVKVAERVYIKFLEVSSNWSGVIRLGFTCNDPITLRNGLPKYACPDLTNKPGYWAKALAERFCARDTILFFYVTSAGDVHFGIDGEEKGIFLSGVDTRNQLWAMIDVYGNSTEIELLDARQHLNNSRRIITNGTTDSSPEVLDRRLITSMQALNVSHCSPPPMEADPPLPASAVVEPPPQQPPPAVSRFTQQQQHHYTPLVFHRTRGRNIRLSNDRCIATRSETEFCQGYVFTARPLQLGERILIQVLATETVFLGALALGLTSCDPATLTASDLPDDSDLLLDRPEYWVVSKDVANYPQRGDELTFSITHSGEVQMSKNGSAPVVLMHVDQSLTLWAFLDVYGSTSKIRILGSSIIEPPRSGVVSPVPREELHPQQQHQQPPLVVRSGNSAALVRQAGLRVALPDSRHPSAAPGPPAPEVVQLGGGVGGGTVLVVNLPPPQAHHPAPDASATLLSTYSHTYIEPVSATSYTTVSGDSTPNMREWAETSVSAPSGSECSICYERAIDSVLYMCGHMCMCYECAVQQWRGKGGGHCPLCRAVIRDVIRTYKS